MMRRPMVLLLTLSLAALGACPEWQRPGCESPGAWRCSSADPAVALPEYCAPSKHWTPRGDEPCARSGRVCLIEADGVATCARTGGAAAADGGAR